MGAPINHFEIVESIRFFGQIVSTEGIAEDAKKIANDYITKLLRALGNSVDETTAKSAGIQILGH